MKKDSRETLDAYYADAASWNTDRIQALRSSQRVAWIGAAAATTVAVLEAGALLLLTPLKTVEPYTLLVDRTTGYVQALRPLDPVKVAPDAALTQSFLVQYVTAREGFDFDTVNLNYRKVALFSGGRARSSYVNLMQASNPESPLVSLPRRTLVETRVKSVSPVGNDVAMVRFETIRTDPDGRMHAPSPWIAVIRYRYSGQPLKLEDRFVNPLGFEVVSYRRDAEALVQSPADRGPLTAAAVSALPTGLPRDLPQQGSARVPDMRQSGELQ